MHRIATGALVLAAVVVLGAVGLLLWPLTANGVSGSALRPHYSHYFAFSSYRPVPLHATTAQLREAGVRLPQDVVASRRHVAYAVLGGGAVLGAVGVLLMIRRREPGAPPAGAS